MSELGNYASLMAWSFLPGMATDWLHKTYYSFRYAKNSPSKPQPHTDRYNLHNRRIYVLVILSYLAYSLFEVVTSLPSNHYKLLSMDPVDFSQRELKTNFRRLSLQYHPDKNVGDDESERMFIKTRIAYEILNDPVRRLAYDKFGQSVATCSTCRTHRDFVYAAYPSYLSFYVGTGVVLLLLNILSKGQFARYWRFTSFLCLASLELSMLLRPRNPLPFQFLLSSFTTREQIQILHNVFISFFMALSHVGPVIFLEERRSVRQVLEKLEKISLANETHALGSFKALLKPFAHNSEAETLNLLRRRMEKIMVESTYQKDSEYVASKNRARGGLRKSK